MGFEFITNITRADYAFRATGKDLEELFTSCVDALLAVLLEDPGSVQKKEAIEFQLSDANIEMLLYDFLHEFLFLKDTQSLILVVGHLSISQDEGGYTLSCKAAGEKINRNRHAFLTDIKAITMHHFEVKKIETGWIATVVVDV